MPNYEKRFLSDFSAGYVRNPRFKFEIKDANTQMKKFLGLYFEIL